MCVCVREKGFLMLFIEHFAYMVSALHNVLTACFFHRSIYHFQSLHTSLQLLLVCSLLLLQFLPSVHKKKSVHISDEVEFKLFTGIILLHSSSKSCWRYRGKIKTGRFQTLC